MPCASPYHPYMARPTHDWYAAAWLHYFHKKQADVVRDLDWNKAKASLMVRGIQPYDRDSLNELAHYLSVEPFELLIPPERAMAYRQYRANAEKILSLATEADQETADLMRNDLADLRYARRAGSKAKKAKLA